MAQTTLPPSALTAIYATLHGINAILLDPTAPSEFIVLANQHPLPSSWADRLSYLRSLPPTERTLRGLIRYQELQPADETGRPYFLYPTLSATQQEAAFIVLLMSTLPDWCA